MGLPAITPASANVTGTGATSSQLGATAMSRPASASLNGNAASAMQVGGELH